MIIINEKTDFDFLNFGIRGFKKDMKKIPVKRNNRIPMRRINEVVVHQVVIDLMSQ